MAHYDKSLEYCVSNRHSIRAYTSDSVDEEVLKDCLRLAQRAPSNSNIQNWRLYFASGSARARIATALSNAAKQKSPNSTPLPPQFRGFRSEFGQQLYGPNGYNIPRDDKERMTAAQLRNYDFFGAPICGVLAMDRTLTHVDAMSVGMFIQTFMLALTERGLGSCLEVSVTGYEEELRQGFQVAHDEMILCGIAVGWSAEHKLNHLQTPRVPLDLQMKWLS